jgi:hypothetical protein
MQEPLDTYKLSRRELIWLAIPVFGTLCMPGFIGCKDKESKHNRNRGSADPVQKRDSSKDELYAHTVTKTLHYPALFKKYKVPSDKHLQKYPVSQWQRLIDQDHYHFPKDTTRVIFETLALRQLKSGVNDQNLHSATSIIGRGFSPEYVLQNKYNWRGYDLLSCLIALDNSVAAQQKHARFKELTQSIDFSSIKKIPKRNTWIQTESEFSKRVTAILSKKEEVVRKLSNRIS